MRARAAHGDQIGHCHLPRLVDHQDIEGIGQVLAGEAPGGRADDAAWLNLGRQLWVWDYLDSQLVQILVFVLAAYEVSVYPLLPTVSRGTEHQIIDRRMTVTGDSNAAAFSNQCRNDACTGEGLAGTGWSLITRQPLSKFCTALIVSSIADLSNCTIGPRSFPAMRGGRRARKALSLPRANASRQRS